MTIASSPTIASPSSLFCCCPGGDPVSNPTNAGTSMVGGKVCFENDNYRITMGDDNSVNIFNKNTGENYLAWDDPHMQVDGQQAFDFWGTTTLALEDGTKVTIETTPWANNPAMTLSSKVTITNADYGVQVTGVDSNQVGDLAFEEAFGFGELADAVVDDGNVLHENPFGKGFLGIDDAGALRPVDQQYINETDLKKGGALKQRFAYAFESMIGLMAVAFVGRFLDALAGDALGSGEREARMPGAKPALRSPRAEGIDTTDRLVMSMNRANPAMAWFMGAAARNN